MENKRISICMATYNGALYIEEQLNSILKQLNDNDEVIISDDGSTDQTLEIITSFKDNRIKLFRNSFKNVILNFEFTLAQAIGDVIFLSDQDDIWYENKVVESLKELEKNDLVFSNLSVFSKDINENYTMYDSDQDHNGFMHNFIKNKCVGATMAFKSDVLKYVMPFPKHIEMHDMWIFFITSFYGKTYYDKKPLIYYRRHGLNVSNTGEKTTNSIIKIIKIRMVMLVSILKRVVKTTFS